MADSESWTDEDTAAVAFEALPAWHPSLFTDVFRTALRLDGAEAERILREALVTPESLSAWGDFEAARAFAVSPLKISGSPMWGRGAPDVAYVRIVDTDAWISPTQPEAAMHATLVWRPELATAIPGSSWRIHHLGEPVHPDLVPRTAQGFDPRKLP